MALQLAVLGPVEALRDGHPVDLGPPQQRAVLAVLLLHAGSPVPVDRVVDQVWGERPPRTAAHAVQVYVSRLRRALGEDVVSRRPPGYTLRLGPPDLLDASELERLAGAAASAAAADDLGAAEASYRAAAGLWRGEPFADIADVEVAATARRRLGQLRVDVLEGLGDVLLRSGDPRPAVGVLEQAVDADPLRERTCGLLVLALYRSGRQAEALRVYDALRRRLDDELGLFPSEELQRLQEQVLLHDPSLDGPSAVAGCGPDGNPYKGLRAFAEADAADFHGRDRALSALREKVTAGERLVALVGPSGAGKSSLLRAGLVPALRRREPRPLVVVTAPGQHPLQQLATAVAAVAAADRTRALPGDPVRALAWLAGEQRTTAVLVVDQLEEVFTQAEASDRVAFLDALVAAAATDVVRVVVALRADFFDRPFTSPEFARLFTAAVVHLTPMTPAELEEAVLRPADRVGVRVEPALLAELVSEMAAAPGALPQLQFTLAELFDAREGGELTLAGYRDLGGLRRALAAGAEEVYDALPPRARVVTRDLVLRMVLAGGGAATQRRVPVRELLELVADPVELQQVLDAFVGRRLLTLDRDARTGGASVELAHEALLRDWRRASTWVEERQDDLLRRDALARAKSEWEASDRHPDFLLGGQRLSRFEEWAGHTDIALTASEREFLASSSGHRDTADLEERERREREHALARRARRRLWGLVTATALLAAAVAFAFAATRPEPPARVALAGEERVSGSYSDLTFAGYEAATERLGVPARAVELATPEDVRRMAEEGVGLVIMPSTLYLSMDEIAREFPGTHFVLLEYADVWDAPNVSSIVFAEQEGSYLAGVAAALTTRTGRVGFVGGVDSPLIDKFQAGYEAGVWSVDPDIVVDVVYLTPWGDWAGFGAVSYGHRAAAEMYDAGADVVYQAAGASGTGVMLAAADHSAETGRHVWMIGVDLDQFALPSADLDEQQVARVRPHVLTSMVKRVDVAIELVIERFERGELRPGPIEFDLGTGAMELATSGGFLREHQARLDATAEQLRTGTIDVPLQPAQPKQLLLDRLAG